VSVALVKQSGAGPEMHPVDVCPFAWKGMDSGGVRQRAYATDQLGRPNPLAPGTVRLGIDPPLRFFSRARPRHGRV
jgi:hypothetical protein